MDNLKTEVRVSHKHSIRVCISALLILVAVNPYGTIAQSDSEQGENFSFVHIKPCNVCHYIIVTGVLLVYMKCGYSI